MNDALLDRYLERIAAGDREGALAVAQKVAIEHEGLISVVDRLVVPAQLEVGRRWERNEWTVPQEHAATAISEWVLTTIAAQDEPSPADEPLGRLVAVCAEGEWHSLPVRVLTEVVRRAGWEVTLLPPASSSIQLTRHLHDEGPDGVLLSCSIPFNLAGARRMIDVARATGTPVMAGGRGFGPDDRRALELRADAWAADAHAAVAQLASWDPFTTPPPPLDHPAMAEHSLIDRTMEDLVQRSFESLGTRFPSMASYSATEVERTVEDMTFLFRFLSASLLVDDPGPMHEYVSWLEVVLTSRGVPPSAVGAGLEAAAEATGTDLPIATEVLLGCLDRWRARSDG